MAAFLAAIRLIEAKIEAGQQYVREGDGALSGKPYRPSCGTEGMAFDEQWCSRCKKDEKFRDTYDSAYGPDDGCQILADTFVYEIDDPKYPKEWIYDADGVPSCTAFSTTEERYRCRETPDLFATPTKRGR